MSAFGGKADILFPPISAGAEIVISAVPIRQNCREPLFTLDLFDVFYGGATALYLTENGIIKVTTAERRGVRPWSQDR